MVELYMDPPRQKIDPSIPADRPVYRVLAEKGFYGPDDTLHAMGELIVLHDVPNEDMEPMNDLARAASEKYIDQLESGDKAVAEKTGHSFLGRRRTKEELIASATESARRIQSVGAEGGVPLMGGKKRGRPRISKVGAPDVAEELGNSRKKLVEVLNA